MSELIDEAIAHVRKVMDDPYITPESRTLLDRTIVLFTQHEVEEEETVQSLVDKLEKALWHGYRCRSSWGYESLYKEMMAIRDEMKEADLSGLVAPVHRIAVALQRCSNNSQEKVIEECYAEIESVLIRINHLIVTRYGLPPIGY